jgi:selenocysteine lyase/cysteine desulfurase
MNSLSLDQFRSRFPLLSRRTYVGSCSQGALSEDVAGAFQTFLTSWQEHGAPWDSWVAKVDDLKRAFARSISADPDEIAVVSSASAGINAIASALQFAGDRCHVVLSDMEFPTMPHVWLAQQERGAHIRWVHADGDHLGVEAYARAIDDRTLIVPATHVCFRNGVKLDITRLAALSHDRGAHVFVDDYQCAGTACLNVHDVGLDFLVTGCYKYLIGPSGVAFLYVRRDLIEGLHPVVTGWFGRANPFEYSPDKLDWAPSARRFETGTPPVPNVFGALAGLELLERIGYAAIEAQVDSLSDRFLERAQSAGYSILTPADPGRRGPLIVLRSLNGPELVRRLDARGVIASARGNGLRIAFHAYNNDEDVDSVIAALEAEAALLVVAS